MWIFFFQKLTYRTAGKCYHIRLLQNCFGISIEFPLHDDFFLGCFHIIQLRMHSELSQLNFFFFWEATTIITFINKFYLPLLVFHTMVCIFHALFHSLLIITLKSRHLSQFYRQEKWGLRLRELKQRAHVHAATDRWSRIWDHALWTDCAILTPQFSCVCNEWMNDQWAQLQQALPLTAWANHIFETLPSSIGGILKPQAEGELCELWSQTASFGCRLAAF